MKYKGGITGLFLMIIYAAFLLYHEYGHHGFIEPWMIISTIIMLTISWFIGLVCEKMLFYSKELRQSNKELQHLFKNIDSFIWSCDLIHKKVTVSKGIERIFGFTQQEFEKNFELWIERTHPDDQDKVNRYYQRLLSGESSKCEWRIYRHDGAIRWIEARGTPIFNCYAKLAKINGVAYDITERKQMEQALEYMAFYDALTDLPNRRLFDDYLQNALARCKRNGKLLAVIFLDLDDFKVINDTRGHEAGDILLKEVSKRLVQCIRDGDVVARLGGDEFIMLIEDVKVSQVREISKRIHHAFTAPFIINNEDFFTSPSFGISLYPKDGDDKVTLMKKADAEMYSAKKRKDAEKMVFDGLAKQ